MKLIRTSLAAGLIAATALLTGCGGDPSADDIQSVFDNANKNAMNGVNPRFAKMTEGLMPKVVVNDVKNCEEVRDDVYRCDVDFTSTVMGVTSNQVSPLAFTQNSKGDWIQSF